MVLAFAKQYFLMGALYLVGGVTIQKAGVAIFFLLKMKKF
jgi:hypothetical protein